MTFVALDLETTWLDAKKDKIIELALVKFDKDTLEVIETYSTLINPWISIPALNSNITGIVDDMVLDAPTFDEVREKVTTFIGKSPIVWHNVRFDRDFLLASGIPIVQNIFIDTFFLANTFLYSEPSISLESLCSFFGISLESAHRALDDTQATLAVLKNLKKLSNALDKKQKETLNFLYSKSEDQNILFLRNYLFSDTQEVSYKEAVNMLLETIWVPEIIEKKPHTWSISLENLFASIPQLEKRENQKMLLELIDQNFSLEKKSVIEAPTWVWKTLGYLLPSIKFSLEKGQQVFISTKSKVLQDQICWKDLPQIQKNIGIDFSFVKIKGQENYISLANIFKWLLSDNLNYNELSFLSKIVFWLFKTENWELDELNYYWEESNYVKIVHSNLEQSLSERNPYREYEFLFKSRRNLEVADIVIINHAVLFTEVSLKGDIFEKIHHLVIDEAHNLEDTVTSSSKKRYNYKEFKFFLLDILKKAKEMEFTDISSLESDIWPILDNLGIIDDILLNTLQKTSDLSGSVNKLFNPDDYKETMILPLLEKVKGELKGLWNTLKSSKLFLRESFFVEQIWNLLEIVFEKTYSGTFIQILSYSQYQWVTLEYTILNVAKFCQEQVWSKLKNVFLLSATCKIGESFSFIEKSIGLQDFTCYSFETDFDYQQQAEIVYIKDLWSVKNNFSQVMYFLKNFFHKVQGKTLVLFTSFSSIRSTYLELNQWCKQLGIHILAQGLYGSKYRILEKFKNTQTHSIVLWTDSFWEGVDIPWDALKYLVIHKLPFSVPTDPIFIARSQLFSDAFSEYSIPKAVLKLKQWMWRLIRTKVDTGKIILLDDRIFNTKWGAIFMEAFPKWIKVTHMNASDFIESIK